MRARTTLDAAERKEIKIMLPERLIVQLRAAKIIAGRQMSDLLTDALEAYFRERPVPIVDTEGRPLAVASP